MEPLDRRSKSISRLSLLRPLTRSVSASNTRIGATSRVWEKSSDGSLLAPIGLFLAKFEHAHPAEPSFEPRRGGLFT